jgi:hypothetical protein
VNGATQVPHTPQERARVLDLLEHARQNEYLHAPGSAAFTLRVSFSASGNVLYTGSGEMEETWIAPLTFRWVARLGDFAFTRVSARGRVFDDRPTEFIPMRLHMLRDAIFWPVNFNAQHSLVRTATVQWKGLDLTCILTSGVLSDASATPGRRWDEREYCIDQKSGLMQVLSDAPGIYVTYDYSDALQFHGRSLPRQVTIVEGGKTVLDAHLDLIADVDPNNPDLLRITPQMQNNSGPILSVTMRFPKTVPVAPGASVVQPVIVHAILNREGKVVDAELLEDSTSALTQSALDLVKRSTFEQAQGGRLQREAFINVQFVSR